MTGRKARGSERRAGAERESEDSVTATEGEEGGERGPRISHLGCLGQWEFLYRNKGVRKKRWIPHPAAPLEDAGRALSSVLGCAPVWLGVCDWAAGEADRSPSSQTPSTTVGKSAHLLELSFLMCKLKKG